MTRKDYQLIARAIRAERLQCQSFDGVKALQHLARRLADSLHYDTPGFDHASFIAACE